MKFVDVGMQLPNFRHLSSSGNVRKRFMNDIVSLARQSATTAGQISGQQQLEKVYINSRAIRNESARVGFPWGEFKDRPFHPRTGAIRSTGFPFARPLIFPRTLRTATETVIMVDEIGNQ